MPKLFLVVIPILVGIFLAKLKIISQETNRKISSAIVYFFAPVLVFYSIWHFEFEFQEIKNLLGIVLIFFLINFFVAKIILSFFKIKDNFYILPVVIINTANLGYPANLLFWGKKSLPFIATFNVGITFLLWTFGIYILAQEKNFAKRLKNIFKIPVIYAFLFGFVLKGHNLPLIIEKIILFVSFSAIPLLLFVLGTALSSFAFKFSKKIFAGVGARFLGGIFSFVILFSLFDTSLLYVKVALVNVLMPSAVMNYVLTVKFGRDREYMLGVILLTTVFYWIFFIAEWLFLKGAL
ncbi:MAG: hypothetical protein J7L42_06835 [Elusimicrobia bacterium]|nr:hypothetical protein [Elusimicrobiota bacterium]